VNKLDRVAGKMKFFRKTADEIVEVVFEEHFGEIRLR
jgi:hypothetical protein